MQLRVLVVEDDPVTQRVLQLRLEAVGCKIVGVAGSAENALQKFRELKPHLVTLDIQMPEINGDTTTDAVSLFRQIRKESPGTEIIVISGTAFPQYRETLMKAGALGYYGKPVNFDKLANDVRKFFPELQPSRPA